MATREEFGKYLLLKKLTEDPLGETFRAGRIGAQGVEQVVLLRALNGPRLVTDRLVEELPKRQAVQQALKSPNIGNGTDLGDVKGVPFIAYEYISGKNLASLLAEAQKQSSPIALDHALLIAERIAQALAVAFETRVEDGRILHGFVVPPLVRISNEGETRVLGFEVGPLLQEMAGRGIFEPAVSAYLAPEILAGEAPTKSDDVYSLGALLFQLLTGTPPTASDPASLAQEIDRAQVAAESQPIPAPLATLLKKSLTPRDNRIPEAVSWHKALTKIMAEGQHSATTFNLAFFMHNLFRTEIERETQELEAEKNLKVEELSGPPPAAAEVAEPQPVSETTGTHPSFAAASEDKGSRAGLWIGLAATVLLLAGGGAGWYFLMGPGAGNPEEAVDSAPEAASQPAPPEPADLLPPPSDEELDLAAAGDGEDAEAAAAEAEAEAEELQSQIQQMINESSRDMEAKLQAQYESQIQELQKQLEETRAAAERAREEARRQEQAAEEARQRETQESTSRTAQEPTRRAAMDEPTDEPETREGTAGAATSPTATDPPATSEERIAGRTGSDPPAEPSTTRRTEPRQPATPPASTQPSEPEPAQIIPPELVRRPQARYPEIARRMGREGTVLLRVLVNESGAVEKVERIGKRVGSGLDEAAIEAARQALYEPGTENGKPKPMWTTLRIEFRP